MADLREQRLRAISELIRTRRLASQEELGEQLALLGFKVTQATISRDLDQVGAVKVRRDGHLAYALPDEAGGNGTALRLATVFRDWVRSIQTAGNLVVIKTPPGSAHLVGVALDRAGLPQVVGTICGDDTLFVAVASARQATTLAASLPR